MKKEKIIVKKYSPYSILAGIVLLILLILLVLYYILLGPILQCANVELCGKPEPTEFQFSWIKLTISLVVIMGFIIFLFISPIFRGLDDKQKIVLEYVYFNNTKFNRYQLTKILQKKENFRRLDKTQVYRIINKLKNIGYINIDSEGKLSITNWGKGYIQKVYN